MSRAFAISGRVSCALQRVTYFYTCQGHFSTASSLRLAKNCFLFFLKKSPSMESRRLYIVVPVMGFRNACSQIGDNEQMFHNSRNFPSSMVLLLSSCDPPEMTIH
jgi:hypothetical protein